MDFAVAADCERVTDVELVMKTRLEFEITLLRVVTATVAVSVVDPILPLTEFNTALSCTEIRFFGSAAVLSIMSRPVCHQNK